MTLTNSNCPVPAPLVLQARLDSQDCDSAFLDQTSEVRPIYPAALLFVQGSNRDRGAKRRLLSLVCWKKDGRALVYDHKGGLCDARGWSDWHPGTQPSMDQFYDESGPSRLHSQGQKVRGVPRGAQEPNRVLGGPLSRIDSTHHRRYMKGHPSWK